MGICLDDFGGFGAEVRRESIVLVFEDQSKKYNDIYQRIEFDAAEFENLEKQVKEIREYLDRNPRQEHREFLI